jgi:hypothetical protein
MATAVFVQQRHAPRKSHIVPTGRTPWRPVRAAHPPSLAVMASQSIPALLHVPVMRAPQQVDGPFRFDRRVPPQGTPATRRSAVLPRREIGTPAPCSRVRAPIGHATLT